MEKPIIYIGESSIAPQSLIPCAERYFASHINYGLFRTVGYRFLVIDSCKQTLKARWCLGAVLSHLMHHYVLTGAYLVARRGPRSGRIPYDLRAHQCTTRKHEVRLRVCGNYLSSETDKATWYVKP